MSPRCCPRSSQSQSKRSNPVKPLEKLVGGPRPSRSHPVGVPPTGSGPSSHPTLITPLRFPLPQESQSPIVFARWPVTGPLTQPIMKRFLAIAIPALCILVSNAQLAYPPTKTVDASDTYFGKTYQDPYRWLENLKDKDVEAWFKAQAELTDGLLAKIPGRDALANEWTELDKLRPVAYADINYENGRVFYKKTLGGENVGKLFFREGWNGTEKLLFDPSAYKPGEKTTIQSFTPSWDGKHVALGFTSGGAEYSEIRVLDVDQGTLLTESFYPSYGVNGWTQDGQSFFYDAGKTADIKSLDIEQHRKTKLHKLGTDIATDIDFFSDESYPRTGNPAEGIRERVHR